MTLTYSYADAQQQQQMRQQYDQQYSQHYYDGESAGYADGYNDGYQGTDGVKQKKKKKHSNDFLRTLKRASSDRALYSAIEQIFYLGDVEIGPTFFREFYKITRVRFRNLEYFYQRHLNDKARDNDADDLMDFLNIHIRSEIEVEKKKIAAENELKRIADEKKFQKWVTGEDGFEAKLRKYSVQDSEAFVSELHLQGFLEEKQDYFSTEVFVSIRADIFSELNKRELIKQEMSAQEKVDLIYLIALLSSKKDWDLIKFLNSVQHLMDSENGILARLEGDFYEFTLAYGYLFWLKTKGISPVTELKNLDEFLDSLLLGYPENAFPHMFKKIKEGSLVIKDVLPHLIFHKNFIGENKYNLEFDTLELCHSKMLALDGFIHYLNGLSKSSSHFVTKEENYRSRHGLGKLIFYFDKESFFMLNFMMGYDLITEGFTGVKVKVDKDFEADNAEVKREIKDYNHISIQMTPEFDNSTPAELKHKLLERHGCQLLTM
jgi:hypothetical protein